MIHIVLTKETGIFAVYIDDFETAKTTADAIHGMVVELPNLVYDARRPEDLT